MKNRRFLIIVFLIIVSFMDLLAQENRTRIEDRWTESQPVVVAYTGAEEYTAGQLVHINKDDLFIYPGKGLPVGPEWFDDVIRIPLKDVDKILLQEGGKKLFRAKEATAYIIPTSDPQVFLTDQKLKKAAIYRDTLISNIEMEEAFKRSHLLRKTFPKKLVRITFGASFGPDVITKDVEDMLLSSDLPSSEFSWNQTSSLELLDISVRIMDRFILGGQFVAQNISMNLDAYSYGSSMESGYYYRISLTESRFYAEYAMFHVDRYFTRPFEVVVGAGLLLSKSDWDLNYNYANLEDMDNIVDGYIHTNQEYRFQGLQLRSAFHYYFFPGLSCFAGLEANLYPSFTVSSLELPSPVIGETIVMPEHQLNFTSVRFKLGVSIYF